MELPRIACHNDIDNSLRGRVLLADLRPATPSEQSMGWYMEWPIIIPDPATIREPSICEQQDLRADLDDPDAIHLFRPPPDLRQEALYWKPYMQGMERLQLRLSANLLGVAAVIWASPDDLSTSVIPSEGSRKVGMHQDIHKGPIYVAGLCLEGARWVVISDMTLGEIEPELRWDNTPAGKAKRRAAFCELVASGPVPRKCLFLLINKGEMYSGLRAAEIPHDGSSIYNCPSWLVKITTDRPLRPEDLLDTSGLAV